MHNDFVGQILFFYTYSNFSFSFRHLGQRLTTVYPYLFFKMFSNYLLHLKPFIQIHLKRFERMFQEIGNWL